MSADAIAAAQADFATTQSVGQQRMASLHGGDTDDLVVYPNVWAGIGLVRGGVGTALVGSYDEVADRIAEYHELGFDEFILSGYPHLEEAYWFGEGVMPVLRERGLLAAARRHRPRPSSRSDERSADDARRAARRRSRRPEERAHRGRLPGAVRRAARPARHRARRATTSTKAASPTRSTSATAGSARRAARRRTTTSRGSRDAEELHRDDRRRGAAVRRHLLRSSAARAGARRPGRTQRPTAGASACRTTRSSNRCRGWIRRSTRSRSSRATRTRWSTCRPTARVHRAGPTVLPGRRARRRRAGVDAAGPPRVRAAARRPPARRPRRAHRRANASPTRARRSTATLDRLDGRPLDRRLLRFGVVSSTRPRGHRRSASRRAAPRSPS